MQVLSVAVILLWIVVALRTAKGAYSGKLFYAPCVATLKPKKLMDSLLSIVRRLVRTNDLQQKERDANIMDINECASQA